MSIEEIPVNRILNAKLPGDIFEKDELLIKKRYRELSKIYHPDTKDEFVALADGKRVEKQAVFAKLSKLYEMALSELELDIWEKEGYIEIKSESGNKYQISYEYDSPFELGHMYQTSGKVIYVIASDKERFYRNYLKQAESFHYESAEMKRNFSQALPRIYKNFKDVRGSYIIIVEKSRDEYPLERVLSDYGGSIDPRHVAWIISRLCNMACFLSINDRCSNGLDVNSLFINPKDHQISYYGAFFYMVEKGARLIGTTERIFDIMPPKVKSEKRAEAGTDLEAIKLIGRTLLGEENVVKLKERTDIPFPIIEFLTSGAMDQAFDEFDKWDKTLDRAYGKREFTTMNYPIG